MGSRRHVLPPRLHGARGLPALHDGREGPGVPQLRLEGPFMYLAIFLFFATAGPGKFAVSTALGWDKDKSLLGLLKQYSPGLCTTLTTFTPASRRTFGLTMVVF